MNAPAFAVTVLRALAGKRLVKVFSTDRQGRVIKSGSDKAAEFALERHELAGADDFFRLLKALERHTASCIVRGAPGPWCPSPGRPMFRLLHPQPAYADPQGRRVSREAAQCQAGIGQRLLETIWLPTLVEAPTSWVLLDFEKIEGEPDWRRDLAGTAAWLKLRLPDAFADARCWYQATSSAADPCKPDLGGCEVRRRLAFVLSRPLTEGQLEAWLGGIPGLDSATFRSAQEIYVGRPIFSGGLVDPMPVRSGILGGLDDIVPVPVIEAPRWSGREAFIACGSVRSAEGLGLLNSSRLDAALERLAAAGGAAGGVRSGLMGAALAYIADVGRERVDIDALAGSLSDAAAPYRSAAEIAGYNIASMISWALEHAPDDPQPSPYYPDAGLSADEAIARLRQEMAAAVGAAVAWRAVNITTHGKIEVNLSPPVVGIKAGAGLGKTGAALEQIAAVPGIEQMNVEIYVPDHRLAQELAERVRAVAASRRPPQGSVVATNAELRVLVIRGRGAAGADGAAMCDKASLAEEVGKAGLAVMTHMCRQMGEGGLPAEECDFAPTCRYLAQFRDSTPAIRILPHAAMFVRRSKALPDPDLIVIDESFWREAVVHKRLALDRLTEAGRWRSRPRKGESPFKAADRLLEAEDFARRVRSAFEALFEPHAREQAQGIA